MLFLDESDYCTVVVLADFYLFHLTLIAEESHQLLNLTVMLGNVFYENTVFALLTTSGVILIAWSLGVLGVKSWFLGLHGRRRSRSILLGSRWRRRRDESPAAKESWSCEDHRCAFLGLVFVWLD